MEALTENSSTEDLINAWNEANNYTEKAMRAIQRTLKRNKGNTIARRVNTPAKQPALYVFFVYKHGVTNMTGILVDGSEGTSVVTLVDDLKKDVAERGEVFILRSHTINRYMERHGFDGTYNDCQEYLFANLVVNPQNVDKYTKEVVVYFNGGVFLGTFKDNRCTLNTWVKNTQLFTNQRLISKRLQDNIEELFKKV